MTETKPRVNPSIICGFDFSASRARKAFHDNGINEDATEKLTELHQIDEGKKPYKSLPSAYRKELEQNMAEHEEMLAKNKNTEKQLNEWRKMSLADKAKYIVSSSRYRISDRAVVAICAAMDLLFNDMAENSINNLDENTKRLSDKCLHDNIETIYSYPLISSLKSFQDFKTVQLTPPVKKAKKKATKNDKDTDDNNDKNDNEEDNDNDEEQSDHESADNSIFTNGQQDSNDDSPSFAYYAKKTTKRCLSKSNKVDARVASSLTNYMSDFAMDFISNRLSKGVLLLMQCTNAKTVSSEHIMTLLEIYMYDGHRDTTKMIEYVDEAVSRWDAYINYFKNFKATEVATKNKTLSLLKNKETRTKDEFCVAQYGKTLQQLYDDLQLPVQKREKKTVVKNTAPKGKKPRSVKKEIVESNDEDNESTTPKSTKTQTKTKKTSKVNGMNGHGKVKSAVLSA